MTNNEDPGLLFFCAVCQAKPLFKYLNTVVLLDKYFSELHVHENLIFWYTFKLAHRVYSNVYPQQLFFVVIDFEIISMIILPFRRFKKDSGHLLAKYIHKYWLTA